MTPLPASADRSVASLARWAAFEMGLPAADVLGPSRAKRLARARFAVWWTARRLRDVSLPVLGRQSGGRDHTTVLHGLTRAEQLRVVDPAFRRLTDRMLATFLGEAASARTAPCATCGGLGFVVDVARARTFGCPDCDRGAA